MRQNAHDAHELHTSMQAHHAILLVQILFRPLSLMPSRSLVCEPTSDKRKEQSDGEHNLHHTQRLYPLQRVEHEIHCRRQRHETDSSNETTDTEDIRIRRRRFDCEHRIPQSTVPTTVDDSVMTQHILTQFLLSCVPRSPLRFPCPSRQRLLVLGESVGAEEQSGHVHST